MTENTPNSTEPFAAYEKAFAKQDRRSRAIIMVCVLISTLAIGYVFTKTLYHLGSLNAYVPGVFEDKEDKSNSAKKADVEYPSLD